MSTRQGRLWTSAILLLLSACGGGGGGSPTGVAPPVNPNPNPGGSTPNDRGTLITTSLAQSLSAGEFTQGLSSTEHGQFLLGLAGPLTCNINIHHIEYWTVAPTPPNSTTTPTRVSGAVMIPTGSAAPCSGPRPIILFARGYHPDPAHNLANIVPTTSDLRDKELVAAYFAAQGYIVVAPNRAGYDISTLGYTPYLNADQNSKDMIDALAAAKSALSGTLASATTPNDKLLVVGSSEGGFVAMATDRALQAAGVPITATVLISGIYATTGIGDMGFLGARLGPLMPFLTTSYQNAYGNVYSNLSDVYSAQYTPYITTVLPNQTQSHLPGVTFNSNPPLTGNAPLDALLQQRSSDPIYSRAFGNPYLITDSYRRSYLEDYLAHPDVPQNGLRQDLKLNDLRSWKPKMPVLLCGGHQDHNVPYDVNTEAVVDYWSAEVANGLVKVLDLDVAPAAGDPYAVMQTGFQQWFAQSVATNGTVTALTNYHPLTAYFCMQAGRQYLAQF